MREAIRIEVLKLRPALNFVVAVAVSKERSAPIESKLFPSTHEKFNSG